jgi:hypothetical protein
MPIGHQDHGGVPVAVPIALGGIDQLGNLSIRQVLASAQLGIWPTQRCNCSIFGGCSTSLRCDFPMTINLPCKSTVRITVLLRTVASQGGAARSTRSATERVGHSPGKVDVGNFVNQAPAFGDLLA